MSQSPSLPVLTCRAWAGVLTRMAGSAKGLAPLLPRWMEAGVRGGPCLGPVAAVTRARAGLRTVQWWEERGYEGMAHICL